MKTIIIGLALTVIAIESCNNSNNNASDAKQTDDPKDTSTSMHQQAVTDTAGTQNPAAFPGKEVLAGYLQLKNALAKDNAKDAATAGNTIVTVLEKAHYGPLPADQQKAIADLQGDMKENAEHIGANAGKIAHQREHFSMLSKDMADLMKMYGNGGQVLYKDFCPMANDGKGAIWISEVKEIRNPYLGSKMPDCGTVKETIK